MVWAATAVIGSAVVSSYASSQASKRAASATTQAAETGAAAQERAAELGIAEQRRQFEELQRVLAPYIEAGNRQLEQFGPYQRAGETGLGTLQDIQRGTLELYQGQVPALQEFAAVGPEALRQQRALAGLAGPEAQRAAIGQIERDPQFQALARQGEEALLQQASATGGLRGGNVQAALAQFRPQLLNQFINQQYERLGGLTGLGGATSERLFGAGLGSATGISGQLMGAGLGSQELLARLGQASAAGQAAGATSLGSSIASGLSNIGAAQAQAAGTIGAARAAGALGQAQAIGNLASSVPSALIMSRFLNPPAPIFSPPTMPAPTLASGGILV